MHIHREDCQHTFTGAELVEIARKQARLHGEGHAAEDDFDRQKADYKALITGIEQGIAQCTQAITLGHEQRSTRCLTLKFRPDEDHALVIRVDTGRVLRNRKLESKEKQLKLTTTEPDPFMFEADFFDEGDTLIADHVQLTSEEARELKNVITVRPTRLQLEAPATAGGK